MDAHRNLSIDHHSCLQVSKGKDMVGAQEPLLTAIRWAKVSTLTSGYNKVSTVLIFQVSTPGLAA